MNSGKLTLLVWLGLGLASGAASATQILKISASRKLLAIGDVSVSLWHPNDSACVERDASYRICGQIIKVMPRALIFAAATPNHDFQVGESITLRKSGRNVAAHSGVYSETSVDRPSSGGISNNLTVGADLLQPVLRYERALGANFALGIMPVYLNFSSSGGSLTGIGGFLTMSYYFNRAFKGFSLMGGAGYYSFSASLGGTTESGSTVALIGGLAYHWLFRSGLNLGLEGGGEYLLNPQTASLQFSGVLPVIMGEIGFAF